MNEGAGKKERERERKREKESVCVCVDGTRRRFVHTIRTMSTERSA